MADGQIIVELKLLMEQAFKQAREGSAAITKEFAKAGQVNPLAKVAKDADAATSAQKKLTKEMTETAKAAQRLKDIASGKLSPVQPGQMVSISGTTATTKMYGPGAIIPGGMAAGLATPTRGTTFPTIKQPGLPTAAFPTLPNAQPGASSWKSLAPLLAAAVGTGVGGPLGGAIAGVLTKMNPAVAGVTAVMTALRFAAQRVAEAFDRARSLYAKTLGSGGLAQSFVTRQNILADVMGVSESQVMQYGYAISQLNAKLTVAIAAIVDTQPALTATAWNFQVLKQNLAALWAKMAEALAPALNRLYEFIGAMTKLEILSGDAKAIGTLFAIIIDGTTRLTAVFMLFGAAIKVLQTVFLDLIKSNFLGVASFQRSNEALKSFKDILKVIGTPNDAFKETARQPAANINRLPGSTWEKMGLIIGQTGGQQNWPQQTAQGVKKLVMLTEKLVEANNRLTGNRGAGFSNPVAAQP